MELEFSAEQDELRASVAAVLARECPITLVREVVEKATVADRLWQQVVALDWPSLTVPEAYGGMGFGMIELAVLMEETGAVVAPLPLLSTLGLFVPTLLEAGTVDQCDRFLRPVTTGAIGTVAVAERSGSWSVDRVAATGRRVAGGLVLAGTKHFVLDADRAAEIVVAVRVDDELTLVVVPGADLSPSCGPTVDGTRPLWTVPLDGISVDSDRVLPGGAPALARALDQATVALSLELVGTCSTIMTIALEYAKVREQFGVKIGSFQAMKHKLADMFVALEAAQATAYHGAAAIAEDDPSRVLATSMAKSLVGDCQRRIAAEGIQTLGGIAYTWEHDLHLYVKRSMASAALMGTTEEHRARVADLLMKPARWTSRP
ncbi:MAG: acyl-CoA dehydrogenase family protein [Acidimicrobiales bacterium]